MKILIKDGFKLNPNEKYVSRILEMIKKNKGICPCDNKSKDPKCPCSDYRNNNDCHCKLYIKIE